MSSTSMSPSLTDRHDPRADFIHPKGLNTPSGLNADKSATATGESLAAARAKKREQARTRWAELAGIAARAGGKLTVKQADEVLELAAMLGSSEQHFQHAVRELGECRRRLATIAACTSDDVRKYLAASEKCKGYEQRKRELLEQLEQEHRANQRESQQYSAKLRAAKQASTEMHNLRNQSGFCDLAEMSGNGDLLTASIRVAKASDDAPAGDSTDE